MHNHHHPSLSPTHPPTDENLDRQDSDSEEEKILAKILAKCEEVIDLMRSSSTDLSDVKQRMTATLDHQGNRLGIVCSL